MGSELATGLVNIGLADESATQVGRILNRLLADEYLVYTKARNYHWNVTGPQFIELHKFFQEQYEKLDEIVDEVAERARSGVCPLRPSMKKRTAEKTCPPRRER